MSNLSIAEFNELKFQITEMIAPTTEIVVNDFKSADLATQAGKQVKDLLSRVEKKRKDLVGPLNDRVKEINAYAKSITEPLVRSEIHLKSQLIAFEMEQDRKRQAEFRRLEEERNRAEAELRAKQEAERAAAPAPIEDDWFGSNGDAEEAQKAIEAKHAEEQAILQARVREQAYEIQQRGIKNARKLWKCESVDLSLVPKEFLIVTLNEKAVLAAARAGVKSIPGVRLWQETSIALGAANTYVPEAVLEEKD